MLRHVDGKVLLRVVRQHRGSQRKSERAAEHVLVGLVRGGPVEHSEPEEGATGATHEEVVPTVEGVLAALVCCVLAPVVGACRVCARGVVKD